MDELLKEIAPLVASETQRASKQYGDKYASAHEAEKELYKKVNSLRSDFYILTDEGEWIQSAVLRSNILKVKDIASDMKKYALNAAAEAIQVAAACEKIARGFEK